MGSAVAATTWPYTRLTRLPSRFSRTRQIPALPGRTRQRWAHATHRTAPSSDGMARLAMATWSARGAVERLLAGVGRDCKGRLLAPMLAPIGRRIPGPNGTRDGAVPGAATRKKPFDSGAALRRRRVWRRA